MGGWQGKETTLSAVARGGGDGSNTFSPTFWFVDGQGREVLPVFSLEGTDRRSIGRSPLL